MNVLIASDIHGSAAFARMLADRIEAEAPDRVALLGDLLYHGPRNPLPDGYAPMEVAEILGAYKATIVAVRGNCDAEVDQMVLPFRCLDTSAQIVDGGENVTLFLTHGHAISPDDPPAMPERVIFCSGHTHVKVLEERNGIVFLNPGSTSLPKDGTRSYATYDSGVLRLKSLDDGSVIRELPVAPSA